MFLRYVFRGSRYRTREIAAGERPAASGVDRGDNSNSAHALAAYLLFENTECRVAYGGVEAVAIGTDRSPDVIIMDIAMPECSGFEAAFALRHDPRTGNIVIVAFTALDEAEVRRHLADQELDGYCQKRGWR